MYINYKKTVLPNNIQTAYIWHPLNQPDSRESKPTNRIQTSAMATQL